MTVYQLQKDLAEEVEKILENMLFMNPKGETVHLKGYCQELPKKKQDIGLGNLMPEESEQDEAYPFCVVKMDSGEIRIVQGTQSVKVVLVFGVFDDNLQHQGHQTLLNVMNKVAEHFVRHAVLKNAYELNAAAGMNWLLDDEDRYPYYIGGMEMTWNTFFVEREDEYV